MAADPITAALEAFGSVMGVYQTGIQAYAQGKNNQHAETMERYNQTSFKQFYTPSTPNTLILVLATGIILLILLGIIIKKIKKTT